jgi:hypothetical protein
MADPELEREIAFAKYGFEICGRPIPPVPDEARKVWEKYREGRGHSLTAVGVRWYLAGESIRKSAEIAGLECHSAVMDIVKRHDFQQFHGKTESSIQNFRRIAYTSSNELARRLDEDPADFTHKELGVMSARAMETVVDYERDKKDSSSSFLEGLGQMTDRLMEAGVCLKLEISGPEQPQSEIEVIDVQQG